MNQRGSNKDQLHVVWLLKFHLKQLHILSVLLHRTEKGNTRYVNAPALKKGYKESLEKYTHGHTNTHKDIIKKHSVSSK